jgi:LysR family glycine cleavage system transcriptional activator
MAIQAAIDGLGIAMAPAAFVTDDVAEGRLVAPFDSLVLPMGGMTGDPSALSAEERRALGYHAYVAEGRYDEAAIVQFLDWLRATGEGRSPQ